MAVRLKGHCARLRGLGCYCFESMRGNADIGDETRRRVLKRMKELNYQPNMMARGLASGRLIDRSCRSRSGPSLLCGVRKIARGRLRTSNRALILAPRKKIQSWSGRRFARC